MECNLALLADAANVDANGKLYILGEFRYVVAPKIPAMRRRFYIVARWEADAAEVRDKEHSSTLEFEVVDVDGALIAPRSPQAQLRFGPIGPAGRGKMEARAIIDVQGLVLTKYGDYVFHFFVNGQRVGHTKFYVLEPTESQRSQPPTNAGS